MVLEGVRARLSSIPAHDRPRVVLIGESLGANVALDVSCDDAGTADLRTLDALGVSGGLYLGVPFRTRLWEQWRADPEAVDPRERLLLVSQPDEAAARPDGEMRHLMVVHHDDPDECLRMPGPRKNARGEIEHAGDMVVCVAGYPAIYGKQPLYFQDPVFRRRSAVAPPAHSDRLRQERNWPVVRL